MSRLARVLARLPQRASVTAALVLCGLITIGVVTAFASAPVSGGPRDGAPDPTRGAGREARDRAEQQEAARRAFRDSPQGRRERADSRAAFRNQSDRESLATARAKFPELVEAPALRWPALGQGERVERYVNDSLAVVQEPGGEEGLIESTLPLRGQTPSGDRAPVDLSLTETGGAYEPRSAPARVRIPTRSTDALRFPDQAIGIRLDGAEGKDATLSSNKAVFANVLPDSDLVLEPSALGAEISMLLRSPASGDPTLRFDLPAGARLQTVSTADAAPGSVEVERGHNRLALVAPALAVDAQGEPIAVTYRVEGDRLTMQVDDSGDVAWPVKVDPTVGVYDGNGQNYASNTPGYSWPWWVHETIGTRSQWPCNDSRTFTSTTPSFTLCQTNHGSYTSGGPLYVVGRATPYSYANGDWAAWSKPARSGAYIYRFDTTNTSNSPSNSQVYAGVWCSGCNPARWEYGEWHDTTRGIWSPPGYGYAVNFYPYAEAGVNRTFCVNQGPNEPNCPPTSGAAANTATFGLSMTGGPPPVTPYVAMGGAATYSSDNKNPVIQPISHTTTVPAGWVNGYSDTAGIQVLDEGLGMGSFTFTGPNNFRKTCGTAATDASEVCPSPPPPSWPTSCTSANLANSYDLCPLALPTSAKSIPYTAPEGIGTYTVAATDIVGNNAANQTWTTKVDLTAPSFTSQASGTLATRTGWSSAASPSVTVNVNDTAPNGAASSGVQKDTIKIDPPNGPSDVKTNKKSDNVTICDASSGCANTLPPHTYTWTSATDGAHPVNVTALDAVGRQVSDNWTFRRDTAKPTIDSLSGSGYQPNGWVSETPKDVVVDASDPLAGIRKVELLVGTTVVDTKTPACTNGCAPTFHDTLTWSPPAGSTEGPRTLTVRVTDAADATGPANSRDSTPWVVNLDTTQPAFGTATGPMARPTGWITDPTVTVPVTDGASGVASDKIQLDAPSGPSDTKTNKKTDGSNCDAASGCAGVLSHPWTASTAADGTHQLTVTATDAVGHTRTDGWPVKLDRTKPLTGTPTGSLYAPGKWIQSGVKTLHVDASDATSGVRRVDLLVDNAVVDSKAGNCSPGCSTSLPTDLSWTPPSNATEGAHAVKVLVVDDAGNTNEPPSAQQAWTIYLDKSDPAFDSFTGSLAKPTGWVTDPSPSLTVNASDTGSGVQSDKIQIDQPNGPSDTKTNKKSDGTTTCDDASGCATTLSHTYAPSLSDGTHQVTVTAKDPLGRTVTDSWAVKLDRAQPTATNLGGSLYKPSGWVGVGDQTVTVDTADAVSGVRRVDLLVDGGVVDSKDGSCTGGCQPSFSPTLTWSPTSSASNGSHNAILRVVDDAGNTRDYPWSVGLDRLQPDAPSVSGGGWNGEGGDGSLRRGDHSIDVTATDAHSGVKRIEVFTDDADNPNDAPTSVGSYDSTCTAGGCPQSAPGHFQWNDAAGGPNRVHVLVRVTDLVGNVRDTEKTLERDSTPPTLALSGPMAPPIASGRALHMTGDDGGTGIRKFELWVDPPADPPVTAADHVHTPTECSSVCPNHAEDDYVLPDTTSEGTHHVLVRLTDDAGLTDEKRFDVHVVSLFPSSRTKLGLEHYFQYDQTAAGGDSNVYVNAQTGNTVWHSVPIVNKGRGLSTVVNLSYNSLDRGGILGSSLGHIPVVDVGQADLSQDLPGLSYSEAGVGFSLGISGPTRLNEPLGGTLVAQAVEEGTQLPELGHPLPQVADMRITMTDSDGTVHSFQKSGNEWVGDPGLDMHLRRYRDGGSFLDPVDDKWAMTRPDGVTHFFDNLGYLTKTEDRNGNALTYHYEYYDALTGDVTKSLDKLGGGTTDVNLCKGVELHHDRLGKSITLTADPSDPSNLLATPQKVYCAKRVDSVTDAGGQALTIAYNDYQGDLLGLADGTPPVEMHAEFPGLIGGKAGRVKQITDHSGRQYDFKYDDNGFLTEFDEASNTADKRVTKLDYEPWKDALATDRVGQDRQLNQVIEADSAGNAGKKTLIRYVDPADRSVVPIPGVLASPRQACGVTKRNTDAHALGSSKVDGQTCRTPVNDLEKTYDYLPPDSGSGSKFTVKEVLNRKPAAPATGTAKVATTTHELDDKGRPTAVIDPLGRRTALSWNDDENAVSSFEQAKGTPDASRTDLTYDTSNHTGVLTSKKTYPSYPDTSEARTTDFTYQFSNGVHHTSASDVSDTDGHFVADLTAIQNPKPGTGQSFDIKQDGAGNYLGNVTKRFDKPDHSGNAQTTTYDSSGQITSEQDGVPGDASTQYGPFDPTGQPLSVIDPRNKTWDYHYDPAGNLTTVIDPRASNRSGDDGSPYTTTLGYDAFDRLTSEKIPKLSAGSDSSERFRTQTREYNRNGTVKSSTDGAGKTTSISYTPMDQPQQVDAPGQPGRTETSDYVYDDADRLIARVDPKGTGADPATVADQVSVCTGSGAPAVVAYMTRYCLDDAGRRLAEVRTSRSQDLADPANDPTALITSYAFDGRDNQIGLVDPRRNLGRSVSAAVDAANSDSTRRFTYQFNKLGQRTDQTEHPATPDTGPSLHTHWDYDLNGNQTTMLSPRAFESDSNGDPSFATTKFYDYRDMVTAVKTPEGCTAYGRREDGKVVATTTPRGTELDTTSTTTDGNCSPASPHQYKYFTTTSTFDGAGNLESRSIPYAKDQYGRSDSEFASWKVVYGHDAAGGDARDAAGNPTTIVDARGNEIHNTYYDSGQIRTTDRPSFYDLNWGKGSYDVSDPARHFTDSGSNADLQLADGGPKLQETGDRSRNAQASGDNPQLPATGESANFGKVNPQDLGNQLPDAGPTSFEYDGEMRLRTITDAAGNPSTIGYDGAGRVASKAWPYKSGDPIEHKFSYDLNGNLDRYTDGRNHDTNYTSDGYNRRIEESTPGAASGPDTQQAFATENTKYGYDANGNLLTRETPRGPSFKFTFAYDSLDRLSDETNSAGDHWNYGYDPNGNLKYERAPRYDAPGSYSASDFQTDVAYDKSDRMATMTRGFGDHRDTTYGYDRDGNQTSVVSPGSQSQSDGSYTDRLTSTTFDGRGLPWSETTSSAGGDDKRTTVKEYDPNGNLKRAVNPVGVNGQGAAKVVDNPGTSMSDATWHATMRTYNADDQLIEVHQPWNTPAPDGSAGVSDPQGPQDAEKGGDSHQYVQEFQRATAGNPLQRVTSVVSPHETGAGIAPRTSYTYYPGGWVQQQSEEKLVRPTSTAPVRTALITFDYDKEGNQTLWRTDSTSDSTGRIVRRTFNSDNTLSERYANKPQADGSEATTRHYRYYYDPNRSLTRIDDFDPVIAGRDGTTQIEPTQPDRTTNIGRDAAERQTSVDEVWSGGKGTTFVYDRGGNVTSRRTERPYDSSSNTFSDSGSKLTTFQFDPLDRETGMSVDPTDGSTRTTSTSWWDSGDMRSRTKSNGTVESDYYNPQGETSQKIRNPAQGATDTQSYAYDGDGNRKTDDGGTHVFDARGTLVSWTRADKYGEKAGTTVTYTHDGNGNVIHKTDTYNPANVPGVPPTSEPVQFDFTYHGERLRSVETKTPTPAGEPVTTHADYSYDALGSVTKIVSNQTGPAQQPAEPPDGPPPPTSCAEMPSTAEANVVRYCFDEFERMVSSRGEGVDKPTNYVYDGLDRRDQKTVEENGQAKHHDYSYVGTSRMLSRETDKNGTLKTYDYDSQGHRLGQSVKTTTDTSPSFRPFNTDANGSVTGLEDSSGGFGAAGNDTYLYDPYGESDKVGQGQTDDAGLSSAAKDNPFRFEGFYYDSGVRTYDMQAREYRPDVGRFLSQDRFEAAAGDQYLQADPLTQNRYAFAGGNPIDNIEFDGHASAPHKTIVFAHPGRHGGQAHGGTITIIFAHPNRSENRALTVWQRAYEANHPPAQQQPTLTSSQLPYLFPQNQQVLLGNSVLSIVPPPPPRGDHNIWDYMANDTGGDLNGLFGGDLGIGDPKSKTYQEGSGFYSQTSVQVAFSFIPGPGWLERGLQAFRGGRALLAAARVRRGYVRAVRDLRGLEQGLRLQGQSDELIARTLFDERRALGVAYKDMTPPFIRQRIYARNETLYGDPLGPRFEDLAKTKSWTDIIESAQRPGGGPLLRPFGWFMRK